MLFLLSFFRKTPLVLQKSKLKNHDRDDVMRSEIFEYYYYYYYYHYCYYYHRYYYYYCCYSYYHRYNIYYHF